MRKEKSLQNIIIVILAIAVLAMSVGFAVYEQNLSITGTATFTASKWDVHFDTSTFNETSDIKASSKEVGNTAITYSVTLPSPGSTYSFTVNVKNFGTIDATLKKITMTGLTTEQAKYITYTVNYAGTDYTQTTDNLSIGLAAQNHATATVTVTVSYVKPANATDLPSTDQNVTLTAQFDYIDAN
ncbi:MAG: hypothetical protein IKR57_05325 [Bacilli bacterium]|nr:hypothetical protein [Bacilli bacterium]